MVVKVVEVVSLFPHVPHEYTEVDISSLPQVVQYCHHHHSSFYSSSNDFESDLLHHSDDDPYEQVHHYHLVVLFPQPAVAVVSYDVPLIFSPWIVS